MNAAQFRMARAALDLSVQELAALAGVSPDAIARLERGEASKDDFVYAIRQALETAGVIFVEDSGEGPGARVKKTPKQKERGSVYSAVRRRRSSGKSEPEWIGFAREDAEASNCLARRLKSKIDAHVDGYSIDDNITLLQADNRIVLTDTAGELVRRMLLGLS